VDAVGIIVSKTWELLPFRAQIKLQKAGLFGVGAFAE
jgi:hypothetical protein